MCPENTGCSDDAMMDGKQGTRDMNADEARDILSRWDEESEEPLALPASALADLTIDDIPDGAILEVGTWQERALHLDWSGKLGRDGDAIYGEADQTLTRKYWYSPLGLEQYLDLVRRAVETRHRVRGDVEFGDYDDDGAFISLRFRINTTETNLGRVECPATFVPEEMRQTGMEGAWNGQAQEAHA